VRDADFGPMTGNSEVIHAGGEPASRSIPGQPESYVLAQRLWL